ncbi:MAG: hydrogenase expression/formation protein HypE [Candidatus Omnitrophica bacterium]|nr:hydrogenase expression/formation protein HypE [Candidatus Omnitrophota bacterium]
MTDFALSCPLPLKGHSRILLGHGSGGALTHELIETVFAPAFDNPLLRQAHDGAVAAMPKGRLAVTTDSYVVQPLFFPGGDIGHLAVYGSVNDLAMCGARPLYLTAAFIIEEGFETATLIRIVASMKAAAAACGVSIITGDTKVVDKGKADGLFINTTGIGVLEHDMVVAPSSVAAGDVVLLSGDIGRHGIAVMAAREGLSFETPVESDAAPLADTVAALIKNGVALHCLRDLTRGGLATALVEISRSSGFDIHVREQDAQVVPVVRGVCEILGLDPWYVANEGRFIAVVPEKDAAAALAILRQGPGGDQAAAIGNVAAVRRERVVMENILGTFRVVEMLPGQLLPRIC